MKCHLASIVLGLGLVACGGASSPPPMTGPSQEPKLTPPSPDAGREARAPVVVALVVDQLSAWVAADRLELLPDTGGFARLRREGTWAKALRLPYAVTDTAAGHASLHTGRTPAESGIWGNERYDLATGELVALVRDDKTKLVGPDGVIDATGSSSARLRVDTVADRLRAAHPDALVVSVSLKDRAAALPAGKEPTHALWFDSSKGTFVTSTAFSSMFPRWATAVAGPSAVERAKSAPWVATDPAWLAQRTGLEDDAPGEGDLDGFGVAFPHVARSNSAFRALPASDAMLFDLALAAVDAEYDPKKPTLLLLSLSASDIIGHVFGPDSWEAWDHLAKLDASLGRFLDELERRVGGDVSVILSADHGNSSTPEAVRARRPAACDGREPPPPDAYERPICAATRIEGRALAADLEAEVGKALGKASPWILGVSDPYVFLTEQARALAAPKRAQLDAAIRRVLERNKRTIAEIYDVRELAKECPDIVAKAPKSPERARAGEDLRTLVCRAWPPDSDTGDYYVVPRPGCVFDAEIVASKGASHGSPYLYDRTVPLLVRAKGQVEAGAVITEPIDFTAYAKLTGAFLGLERDTPKAILDSVRAPSR